MKKALDTVNERILAAAKSRGANIVAPRELPRLIAVSKLKPTSAIIEAYEHGHRYFGENYIQELETKSNSPEIIEKCPEIKFHFIGHLQSNKVNKLLKVRNLHMIESVDSIKLADLLNKAIDKHLADPTSEPLHFVNQQDDRLKVLIQVNTSGEEQKNGIDPDQATPLANFIVKQCNRLQFAGLMTIGKLDGWDNDDGPNPDFINLYQLRDIISEKLSLEARDLELSMGMSSDFEEAIQLGSTNVRVGTMIFGERPPKKMTTTT